MQDECKYEAARFALLSRISASLRHKFVGRLQPIGFAAALAGKQIQKQNFNAAIENIDKLQSLVRQATESAISVMAWITEEEPNSVLLKEGAEACIELIRTDCEMRGLKIEIGDLPDKISVQRRVLRTFVASILLAIVDASEKPVRVCITSAMVNDMVKLHFNIDRLVSDEPVADKEERRMCWGDVDALALHEKIMIKKSSEIPMSQCELFLPTLA